MKCSEKIRALLRSDQYRESGLTINQLSILTRHKRGTVVSALEGMPDKYVAEWKKERSGPGRDAKVIKVVIPPPDAPPPPKGRRQ